VHDRIESGPGGVLVRDSGNPVSRLLQ